VRRGVVRYPDVQGYILLNRQIVVTFGHNGQGVLQVILFTRNVLKLL
jgi:hypothetical protein